MSTPELFTLSEIAGQLLLSPPTVANWRSRYENFPPPIKLDGKRELWTIESIQEFMASRDLNGRDRKVKHQIQIDTDYTQVKNMVTLLTPTYRPEEALLYLLVRVWDCMNAEPSINTKRLIRKLESVSEISVLSEIVNLSLKARDSDLRESFDTIDKAVTAIARKTESRKFFALEVRSLWAQTGRDRAAMTSPELLGKLIGEILPAGLTLELCAGLGSTLTGLKNPGGRVAQEIDPIASAALYLLLSIEEIPVEIFIEDSIKTLHRDWLNRFDCVVCIPPSRTRNFDFAEHDPRWMKFGDMRIKSEESWILNALSYLNVEGIALIGLPTKWMTSPASSNFRKKLVGLGHVRVSISMGADLFSDNRAEMTILVLSSTGRPNDQIQLIDARKFGVSGQENHVERTLNEINVIEIVNMLTRNVSDITLKKPIPKNLVEEISCEDLLGFGAPLEIRAYQANKPVEWSFNATKMKQDIEHELNELVELATSVVKELKIMKSVDEKIRFGEQHPTTLLQEVAELEFFSRRTNETWPTAMEFRPTDLVISLIRNDQHYDQVLTEDPRFVASGPPIDQFDQIHHWKRICRIRLNENSLLSATTIKIYLETPLIKDRLRDIASTKGNKSIPEDVLRNLQIPCVPKGIQEKALSIYRSAFELQWPLTELDDRIDAFYANQNFQRLLAGIIIGGRE